MALPPPDDERVPMRRPGPLGPQGGGVYLSRVQQTRLLDAAVEVVAREGVKRLSATRVAGRAGMSTKTFYDLFADGEDCFLAVFSRAVGELAIAAGPAWAGQGEWVERVRAGLIASLARLERDPALGTVVFVQALGAGPRVLARRAQVLDRVAGLIDEGRAGSPLAEVLPSLTAAGVAGAAFSIVHARLVEQPGWGGASRSRTQGAWRAAHASDRGRRDAPPIAALGSLMELVGPLMATIVLPYRGREAAARELARPLPELPALPELVELPVSAARPERSGDSPEPGAGGSEDGAGRPAPGQGALEPVAIRPTKRTYMVLASVAEHGGANNRRVAAGAEIHDDAQISRLLARLEGLGLVENTGGRRAGLAKSWWLTAAGEEFLRTGRARAGVTPAAGRVKPAGARAGSAAGGQTVRAGRPAATRGSKRGGALPRGAARLPRADRAEARRAQMLRAAVAMTDEHGYAAVTVGHIAARAKVSRRAFYELFGDREQCLLAVLGDIDAQLTGELRAADVGGLPWRERMRLGLWTVLRFCDREPAFARFCLVHSARGEERIAAYRERMLARLTSAIAAGSEESLLGESSPLVAEGIAGGVVSILSTRLAPSSGAGRREARGARKDPAAGGPLSDLLGELMALIVLPYLGAELAQEERTRPVPTDPAPAPLQIPAAGGNRGGKHLPFDPTPGPRLRITYRTALVLEAIAQRPGISNLDVARHAQINDQGQISKLLSRLERHGLVQNTGRGQTQGAPNEWRLTPAGQKLEREIREHHKQEAA
jgi:AcrR family transcriptional regulator/DNA-binding PadR family transcriptional regulator